LSSGGGTFACTFFVLVAFAVEGRKKIDFIHAACTGLAALGLISHAEAAAAGATAAELKVESSGAAKYTIPIAVPSGVGDLEPRLSIMYDSQAGRGIASTGWSLEGVPSVKRCPQTKRQDGKRGGITLTGEDRFCLDGHRLVLDGTNAAYGADGAVYRTELDLFSRVTSYGATGSGPTWFKVETRSGLTIELGGTADSRWIPAPASVGGAQPSTVAMWSASKVVDRVGNEVLYRYMADAASGSQWLSRIDFNRGKSSVVLDYIDDSNPRVAFIAGTKVTHPKLLKDIRTYSNDGSVDRLAKQYRLEYEYSDARGGQAEGAVARLKSLTECDAAAQCLPPVSFEWAAWTTADRSFRTSVQAGTGAAMSGAPWTDDRIKYRRFVDLDKDGKTDIVGFGEDGVYVLFSKPGFDSSSYENSPLKVIDDYGNSRNWPDSSLDLSLRPRHLVDMNRDGHADIVGFNNWSTPIPAGVYLSEWNPGTRSYSTRRRLQVDGGNDNVFTSTSWGPTCGGGSDLVAPKYLVDMNDDGYPDLVGFDGSAVKVSLWNGTKFLAPVSSTTFRMNDFVTSDCMGVNLQPIFLEDMNDDGAPDIVAVGVGGEKVLLWNPATQTFLAPAAAGSGIKMGYRNSTFYAVHLADMNGDGYPDLVQFGPSGINVALWNGKSFNTAAAWTTSLSGSAWSDYARNPRRIADLNGDGFPDIVGFANDGVYVALSNGRDAFASPVKWTDQFPARTTDAYQNKWDRANVDSPRYVLDMDGDGMADIVGLGSVSIRWASAAGPQGTRITKVTDSLGAVATIRYTLAQSFGSAYANDVPTSSWPLRDANGPIALVSEIERDDGAGGKRRWRHRYGGRKAHFDDGPLGFGWSAVRDEATGIETYTTFEQSWPHAGTAKSIETYRSSVSGEATLDGCGTPAELCFKSFGVSRSSPSLARTTYGLAQEALGVAGEYAGNTRTFPYVSQIVEERWELDNTSLPTKTTTLRYEEPRLVGGSRQWGNLTQESVDFGDGYSTTADNAFEPAVESTWTLGRLKTATVTATRPSRTVNASAPTDAAAPPGSAGPLPLSPAVVGAILSILLDD
jgi:hypothetical protein